MYYNLPANTDITWQQTHDSNVAFFLVNWNSSSDDAVVICVPGAQKSKITHALTHLFNYSDNHVL